jgi:2-polyprenyl-3-methyl-5-hydroxy-6-metoxy-1,4-benzoquinol methylase
MTQHLSEPRELIDPISRWSSKDIIERWRREFDIDVTRFFNPDQETILYEGRCSRLQYFTNAIAGDDAFYQECQRFEWYYESDKWEFRTAISYLHRCASLLDVGCGKGAFLNLVRNNVSGLLVEGLELNSVAASIAQRDGFPVFTTDVSSLVETHPEHYDCLTAFQVLEHVSDPLKFLNHCDSLLKPGGKMMISVPNRDSLLSSDSNLLEFPPHHLNRWGKATFEAVAERFRWRLVAIRYEPLRNAHMEWYSEIACRYWAESPNVLVRSLFRRPSVKAFRTLLPFVSRWLRGHTIFGVFEKPLY